MNWLPVIALLALLACAKSSTPPGETWGVAEYASAGLPASDHTWTPEEHTQSARALAAIAADSKTARLPRKDGPKSGPVFARMIEPLADNRAQSVQTRFGARLTRYDAIKATAKLYMPESFAPPNRDWFALMGALLRESAILAQLVDPLLAAFGPDDPKRAVRLDGVAKMRAGWRDMLLGALLTIVDARVAESDRIGFARELASEFPTLYAFLDEPNQTPVRNQLAKTRAGLPPGPLLDALPTLP